MPTLSAGPPAARRTWAVGRLVAATCVFSLLAIGCDNAERISSEPRGQTGPSTGSGQTSTTPTAAVTTDPRARRDDFAAIRRLLKDRAQALTNGNRAAFIATVDRANPSFVARQRTYFDNIQVLPVGTVSYEMERYGLTPAPVSGDNPVLRPGVTEHVLMPGTDKRPVANEVSYTFVKRDRRWLLGAEQPGSLRGQSVGTSSRPWSGDPIAVEVRGNLIVVTDQSEATRADDLAVAVLADIKSVSDLLHQPLDTRLLVDATSTGQATRVEAIGHGDAAAVTYPVQARHKSDVTGVAGWRIKINPHRVKKLMLDPVLLRHEVTHYVLRRIAVGAPTWLSEGIAEVAGYWPTQFNEQQVDPAFYRKLLAAPRELPESAVWSNDPAVNYLIGRAAVDYLMRTNGVDRLVTLMRAYGRRNSDVYGGDTYTRALLKKTYGVTEAEVVKGAFALLRQFHH